MSEAQLLEAAVVLDAGPALDGHEEEERGILPGRTSRASAAWKNLLTEQKPRNTEQHKF